MLSFHMLLLSADHKALCKRSLHHYLPLHISASSRSLLFHRILCRRFADRRGSVVQLSASVIASALVFDHAGEATWSL